MYFVKPKKQLGQHFLKDEYIAGKIASSLTYNNYKTVVEVGPGMGMLTKYLVDKEEIDLFLVEVDRESVDYLNSHFEGLKNKIISADFLRIDLSKITKENFAVIGNFPYNISSQILFKVLDYKDQIPEVVGMFQKEVALRIAAKHNNKSYGIISVLLQVYYDIEYLFTVDEHVFNPPPKVKSAVIRLVRKENYTLGCDEMLLKNIVKTSFNQRRKTLRNSLKALGKDISKLDNDLLNKRAEQLSIQDFIDLTNKLS
jgi:16S rRNA (adenine1518-N6/adenine1519-N6)-dimethyltransferase